MAPNPKPLAPLLMGILNVTPDSFSDGGLYLSPDTAVDAGLRMLDEGADILDIGGESTRPGAAPVPLDEELRRVLPVGEALARRGAVVSIDTMKAQVAREALAAGAQIVNDVTALEDEQMVRECAEGGATVCLMHMQGRPGTMQQNPEYADVVREVREFLVARAAAVEAAGIDGKRIWIDPGIGFGKTDAHNFALLRNLAGLVQAGYPVLIGVSRKGFIGRALGSLRGRGMALPVQDRLEGTLARQVAAQLAGVSAIRCHDVLPARRAIDMIAALQSNGESNGGTIGND